MFPISTTVHYISPSSIQVFMCLAQVQQELKPVSQELSPALDVIGK